MMMSLGMFVFSLPTLAYQELQRTTTWSHVETKRIGAAPANQFLGPESDKIKLGGLLAPELGGNRSSIEELRTMGYTGNAFPLVDGGGGVLGAFVIESVSESQAVFFEDGEARKIDFDLALKRVDEPAVGGSPQ